MVRQTAVVRRSNGMDNEGPLGGQVGENPRSHSCMAQAGGVGPYLRGKSGRPGWCEPFAGRWEASRMFLFAPPLETPPGDFSRQPPLNDNANKKDNAKSFDPATSTVKERRRAMDQLRERRWDLHRREPHRPGQLEGHLGDVAGHRRHPGGLRRLVAQPRRPGERPGAGGERRRALAAVSGDGWSLSFTLHGAEAGVKPKMAGDIATYVDLVPERDAEERVGAFGVKDVATLKEAHGQPSAPTTQVREGSQTATISTIVRRRPAKSSATGRPAWLGWSDDFARFPVCYRLGGSGLIQRDVNDAATSSDPDSCSSPRGRCAVAVKHMGDGATATRVASDGSARTPEAGGPSCQDLTSSRTQQEEAEAEHRQELRTRAARNPQDVSTASFALQQPVPLDEIRPIGANGVTIERLTTSLYPFAHDRNFTATIEVAGGKSIDEVVAAWRTRILFSLDREAASRSSDQAAVDNILRLRARVASGELPIVAIALRGRNDALASLADEWNVFSVALQPWC